MTAGCNHPCCFSFSIPLNGTRKQNSFMWCDDSELDSGQPPYNRYEMIDEIGRTNYQAEHGHQQSPNWIRLNKKDKKAFTHDLLEDGA
jgi:hypothetical protein